MYRTAIALALCLAASPALADAHTYKGTIGSIPIVLELSDQPTVGNAGIFGRYFYVSQGVDIPLHAAPAGSSYLGLVEEVACSADRRNCPGADSDTPSNPPLGATWKLELSRDGGSRLSGEFSLNGRSRPVTLYRIGTRPFDPATGLTGLQDFATSLFWEPGRQLTPATSPYDYLKVTEVAPALSDPIEMQGGTFRFATDPRTKFQYPRIVDLGGYDVAPANAALEQRHWMMSLDALRCASEIYQGFGWNGYNLSAGTLGAWDDEVIEVHYLGNEVMSWTEGGSLYCGGASPYNHYEFHNLDTVRGVPLDLSLIFRGWVATGPDGEIVDLEEARANPGKYHWGPDAELTAFIQANRPSDAALGLTGDEDDCPIDELIESNLAIGFKGDSIVRFSLDGLPNVIQACAQDLYETPLAGIVHLLQPGAESYFPVLAH